MLFQFSFRPGDVVYCICPSNRGPLILRGKVVATQATVNLPLTSSEITYCIIFDGEEFISKVKVPVSVIMGSPSNTLKDSTTYTTLFATKIEAFDEYQTLIYPSSLDVVAPVITVDSLITSVVSPELTGTINDSNWLAKTI